MKQLGNSAKRDGGGRGFALLDLMVSVLILGFLLIPLALARNNVILMAGQTVMLRKARELAAVKMGELELEKVEDLAPGGGDFGAAHPDFTWETKVEIATLREIVGEPPATTEEDAALDKVATADQELADAYENFELRKLTLEVTFKTSEGEEETEALSDLGIEEEGPRFRPVNKIVMVRYFLRQKTAEEIAENQTGLRR